MHTLLAALDPAELLAAAAFVGCAITATGMLGATMVWMFSFE